MKQIPEGVFGRLTSYLNCLLQLNDEGIKTVSSARLGDLTGINPAQIRRDVTYFGAYGKKGVGYETQTLIDEFKKILHSDEPHQICIVGAGNLGAAIANHGGLRQHGFTISAIFDNDPDKIGTAMGGVVIEGSGALRERIESDQLAFAIVAVPSSQAQKTTDLLVEAGIRVILNYTPVMVSAPPCCQVHNSDPVKQLLLTLRSISSS